MAVPQSSYLCRIPREVLENIALQLSRADLLGPLSDAILPLLLTCKQIRNDLDISRNSHLYARIFGSRFDVGAAARRMGDQTSYSQHLARQLQSYCTALQCIRRADIHDKHILSAFWNCFLMMMENDGNNRCQLEAAGLGDFVDEFVRSRLYEDALQSNGWPKESPINSLALWLLWFSSTEERLQSESPARRNEMVKLLLPYVIIPFRYATAFAAQNHHILPLAKRFNHHFPHSVVTAHGPFPVYRNGHTWPVRYYDRPEMMMGLPLASVAAKLVFFSRRQVVPIGVPPHLPLTRAHALQLGHTGTGPTQEDVHELNTHKIVKLPCTKVASDHDGSSEHELDSDQPLSAAYDDDWFRMTDCIYPFDPIPLKNTHYTPGMLDGLWQGRMLIPEDSAFAALVAVPQFPANFNESNPLVNAAPIFMRLREYHCIDPQTPVDSGGPGDGFDDGLANAWLPRRPMYEIRDELHIQLNDDRTTKYERFVRGRHNSHNPETCKSCLYRGSDEVVYRELDNVFLEDNDAAEDTEPLEDDVEEVFESVGMGRAADEARDDPMDEYDDDNMDVDSDGDDSDLQSEYTVKKKCTGVLDIIVTGETDMNHGQAWNHYKFYGRVREWDGLIALVRAPRQGVDAHGRWVFTGYIVGGQNFVGTWRAIGDDVGVPTWESAFIALKILSGKLFDPYTLELLESQVITVDEASGLILDVQPFSTIDDDNLNPQDTTVIDLRHLTVLPGLVDTHVHFFLHPYSETSWEDQLTKESLVERTVRATVHAKRTLMAGFTTVRDLGTEGAGDADIALRKCLSNSSALIPGPRYFCATRAIVPTGSYGPKSRVYVNQEGIDGITGAEVADGREECMKAVRRQIGAGADWIKIYADYRVRSRIADVSFRAGGESMSTFSSDELKTMIDTAHQYGVKVAAHATNKDTITELLRHSVDSIEHGYDMASSDPEFSDQTEDEPLRTFAHSHTKWVPTLGAYYTMSRQGNDETWKRAVQTFRTALARGMGNIACGGDTGVFAHGENALELSLMVAHGADWRKVLRWATLGGWECVRSMRWEGPKGKVRIAQVGELKEDPRIVGDNDVPFGAVKRGFIADVIATSGNLETDFQGAVSAENIQFVMKGGRVYKRDGSPLM